MKEEINVLDEFDIKLNRDNFKKARALYLESVQNIDIVKGSSKEFLNRLEMLIESSLSVNERFFK